MKKTNKLMVAVVVACLTMCLMCAVGICCAGSRIDQINTTKVQAVLNSFQLNNVDTAKISGETTAKTTLDNTENQGETTEGETDKIKENENSIQISTAGKIGLVVGIVVLALVPLISHIIKIKLMKKKK